MNNERVKVFIFSEQPLFREGIRQWLSNTGDLQVSGQAKVSDKTALLNIETMPPDIVVIDIDTTPDNGLNLANRLKRLIPSIGIILLTSKPSDEQIYQALEMQVAAYLSKEIGGDYLADVIRRVANGEQPIDESLTRRPKIAEEILRRFQELSVDKGDETLVSPLTPREMEVLNYIAQGHANKQIAAMLNVSEQTIKNHVASILTKLNANARTEAVVIALRKGLISID